MKELKGTKKSIPHVKMMKAFPSYKFTDNYFSLRFKLVVEQGKGVKKRYIPPTQIVSFPADAPYNCVIQKAREIFFLMNLMKAMIVFASLTPVGCHIMWKVNQIG